jgi:DNA-binding transcriptional regulator YiaG
MTSIKSARLALGLSVEGMRVLLELGPYGDDTIRQWESGKREPPPSVQLLLRVLVAVPAARKLLKVDDLAERYPPRGVGRPKATA